MPEILLILLGVILIGTALYHILPDYLDNKKSADTYQALEEKYLEAKEPETEADTREPKKDWWATDVTVAFDALKKENEEIIGWLRFDDADDLHISYPVLYSGDDEKYLRSDIYGEEHIAGSLFLEGKSKPDFSDYYTIIYGHNMRDGSMFGDLDLYKETDFWKNHQYFTLNHQKFQTVSGKLSWSHYCELLTISDQDKRSFYEKETINSGWSIRELKRQISTSLYERLLLSEGKTNKETVLALAEKGIEMSNPLDIIKDPYVFEFLGVPENKPMLESDLEKALVAQIEKFLLELGRGFMFVGTQQLIAQVEAALKEWHKSEKL